MSILGLFASAPENHHSALRRAEQPLGPQWSSDRAFLFGIGLGQEKVARSGKGGRNRCWGSRRDEFARGSGLDSD